MSVKPKRELIFRQVGDFKVEVVDREGNVKFTLVLNEKGTVYMSTNNVMQMKTGVVHVEA